MNKEKIRREIQQQINDIPREVRLKKDQLIRAKLLVECHFKQSRCVCIYVSLEHEVDTHAIIKHCLNTGKRVVVPKVNLARGTLEIREITQWNQQLEKGAYGILEPKEELTHKVELNEIDCVVLPGVAFDKNGNRIGSGGGYYDRFLPLLKDSIPRIALAYDCQLIQDIPLEVHDQKVHTILSS